MKTEPELLPSFPEYPERTAEIEKEETRILRIAIDRMIIPDEMNEFVHQYASKAYSDYYDQCRAVDKKIRDMGYILN